MMKKIIYIELCNFKDYPLGGHLSFAIHLATAMGGDIDLAGCRTDHALKERTWHTNVPVCGYEYEFYNIRNIEVSYTKPLVPARVTDYFRLKKCICEILDHKPYDIIIVQTPEVLFNVPKNYLNKVCMIAPGVGNPLAISRYSIARKFASLYDRIFFSRASKISVILPAADVQAVDGFVKRSKGKLSGTRIVPFPTRYDASIFHPSSKLDTRRLLNIPEDQIIILTTGRLNRYKGWQLLIDAFSIFHSRHENSSLYFLGKGEDESAICEYSKAKKLSDAVVLAGVFPIDAVANYLNASDLFVMGSFAEGWSTSLVEAVACALPCVVTRFSSADSLVSNGENGYVLETRSEKDFADRMEDALKLDAAAFMRHANGVCSMSVQAMREQLNRIIQFE